jgi:hypothetical protein
MKPRFTQTNQPTPDQFIPEPTPRDGFDEGLHAARWKSSSPRPLRKTPPEDLLFSSYYKLRAFTIKKTGGSTYDAEPCLEGIDFGCRVRVIFSPRDLTCGWDSHEHPRGLRVVTDQVPQIGAKAVA